MKIYYYIKKFKNSFSAIVLTPLSSMDLNDYGEPVMSVLREKYAHLSLLLRKQIDVSFIIDAQMFVNQEGIAWDDVHRKDLKMKIYIYFKDR